MADIIVIHTMTGSCVDTTSTAIQSDVVTDNDERFTVQKWMLCLHILAFAAFKGSNHRIVCFVRLCHNRLIQCRCHNIILITALDERIFKIWAKANCLICRNCPRCRCPDDKIGMRKVSTFGSEKAAFVINHTELDKNGVAGIFLIFYFRFSKSSLTVGTPINWFQSFINQTFLTHVGKDFNLLGFIIMG